MPPPLAPSLLSSLSSSLLASASLLPSSPLASASLSFPSVLSFPSFLFRPYCSLVGDSISVLSLSLPFLLSP